MKALICKSPGNFGYEDVPAPVPDDKSTLLRIRRIGVCGTDLHAFEGTQPYFSYPRILGHELAAEVVNAERGSRFVNGELVTVIPYFNCGVCIACRNGKPNCCIDMKVCGVHIDGGMREYLSVPSYSLVHGDGLSEDALALVEPLAIGAHAVRRARIMPGEFVLVVGAGPIGLGIMELARIAGGNVIALDVNPERLAFSRSSIKVQYPLNAGDGNVKEQLAIITKGDMPTVVFDATGNLKAINGAFEYIAHGGRYILVGLQKEPISFSHPEFHKREATLMSSRNATREDFERVMSAIQSGAINPTNFITHRSSFDDAAGNFPVWLKGDGVVKAVIMI